MSDAAADRACADRVCTVYARAKLNLSLRVLAREASGYHQLETLFCLIELADGLEVTLRDDARVTLDVQPAPESAAPAPELGPVTENLAFRAAVSFKQATGSDCGAAIRLAKRIPAGAGLGGGSSDAAAVLEALNHLHGEPLSRAQLIELAGQLGSDVPFFAARIACALAWGRGNRFAELSPLPSAPVLLALPAPSVATADAYRALAAGRGEDHTAPAALVRVAVGSWRDVASVAVNDFEPIIFRDLPELARIRDAMQQHGAALARMTGTGSTVFGVFGDVDQLHAVQVQLASAFPATRFIETRTATV